MSKKLVVSHLLNRVYYSSISKDGLMGNDGKDVTDEFRFCVLEYLKKTDDKAFKDQVRKLVIPSADDPIYHGPAIICPHCKKEITIEWLSEDMDANADMLIIQGEYDTDCPHCQSSLEFTLDGHSIYNSISVKFIAIKEPCEQCGYKCESEELELHDGKKICILCQIKQKKAKKEGGKN